MYFGYIIFTTINGRTFTYANKFLTEKTGFDNSTFNSPLFKGVDCCYYAFTGQGDDKLSDQTGLGKLLGDYEFFQNQLKISNIQNEITNNDKTLLKFPELDSSHNPTTSIERHNNNTNLNTSSINVTELDIGEISNITYKTYFAQFPFGKEASELIARDSPNYYGTNEQKIRQEIYNNNILEQIWDENNAVWINKPIYDNFYQW